MSGITGHAVGGGIGAELLHHGAVAVEIIAREDEIYGCRAFGDILHVVDAERQLVDRDAADGEMTCAGGKVDGVACPVDGHLHHIGELTEILHGGA